MRGAARTIYLVRHGETVWNTEGRRQGRADSPLTKLGRAQASAAGRLLRALANGAPVAVQCSPLGRTRVTAQILCRELGSSLGSLAPTPLLAEADAGAWEGLTHAEIEARYPGELARRAVDRWNHAIPGAETYPSLYARAHSWLDSLAPAPSAVLVAITHEMMSRALRAAYGRLEPGYAVELRHPQDRIYRLSGGEIEEMPTGASVAFARAGL